MLRLKKDCPLPPSGWGCVPELCCVALALLVALLAAAGMAPEVASMETFVAAPRAPATAVQPPEPVAAAGAAAVSGSWQHAVAAPRMPQPQAGREPEPETASVVALRHEARPPPRYSRVAAAAAADLAQLWRQRADAVARRGELASADRMYSQAMSLAVAQPQLLRAIVRERVFWLRYSGRHFAARQVLRSAGMDL